MDGTINFADIVNAASPGDRAAMMVQLGMAGMDGDCPAVNMQPCKPTTDQLFPDKYATGVLDFTLGAGNVLTMSSPALTTMGPQGQPAVARNLFADGLNDSGAQVTTDLGWPTNNPLTRIDTNIGPLGTLQCDFLVRGISIEIDSYWFTSYTGTSNGGPKADGYGSTPSTQAAVTQDIIGQIAGGLCANITQGQDGPNIVLGPIGGAKWLNGVIGPGGNAVVGANFGRHIMFRRLGVNAVRFTMQIGPDASRVQLAQIRPVVLTLDPNGTYGAAALHIPVRVWLYGCEVAPIVPCGPK